MDEARQQKLEALFGAGLDINEARDYLLEACGDDHELKDELKSLWENSTDNTSAAFNFDAILQMSPGVESPAQGDALPKDANAYHIIESIASGGMGTVYKAEQQSPIKRLVALKTLNTGAVSDEHLIRFKIEQNALALLKHSYIASVFDSGITSQGLPFYTMEFIEGLPITDFCDEHGLDVRDRLELFAKVCDGMQHAHINGVIHRDLKPSNILVVFEDGEPVPKIIDFGIAKLEDAGEEQHKTHLGAIIGTPDYMSPEQAAGGELISIDIRTDVYSLGVILYELLTGVTPLGDKIRAAQTLPETCRVILEEDPPRPSSRIGENPKAVSHCGLPPAQLRDYLKNDLDWVIMKALDRNPNQRYGSCSQLAQDVLNFLEDRPVIACPPDTLYLIGKFTRRYRRQVITSATILFLVLAGITSYAVQQARAKRAIQLESNKNEAVVDFLTNMFKSVLPGESGRDVKVIDVMKRASDSIEQSFAHQPEIKATLWNVIGTSYDNLGIYDEAALAIERYHEYQKHNLGENHQETLYIRRQLGSILSDQGRLKEAEPILLAVHEKLAKLYPRGIPRLDTMHSLSVLYRRLGQYNKADQLARECIRLKTEVLGERHESTLETRSSLARILSLKKDMREATGMYREVLSDQEELLGRDHMATLVTLNNFSIHLNDIGLYTEMEAVQRQLLAAYEKKVGVEHPFYNISRFQLGLSLYAQRRYLEALPFFELCYEYWKERNPWKKNTLDALSYLGLTLKHAGKPQEAAQRMAFIAHIEDEAIRRSVAMIQLRSNLGEVLIRADKPQQAAQLLEEVISDCRAVSKEGDLNTIIAMITLGEALAAGYSPKEACPYFRQSLQLLRDFHMGHPYIKEVEGLAQGSDCNY